MGKVSFERRHLAHRIASPQGYKPYYTGKVPGLKSDLARYPREGRDAARSPLSRGANLPDYQ